MGNRANRPPLRIIAGWLIDGSGGPVRENVLMEIAEGCIRKISGFQPGAGLEPDVIDLSQCTVIPGLIDSHVHLFMSGTVERRVRDRQMDAGFGEARCTIAQNIRQHLCCGVVAVRDGGDSRGLVRRYQAEYLNRRERSIVLKVAGKAWHRKGRYGRLIGRPPSDTQTLAEAIWMERDGIDHVKIVNSGLNSLIRFGRQTPPQFDLPEMREAVDAARRCGLRVMVHANGEAPVEIAVKARCHSVEHGFFMGKDNLMRMADDQVTWVPTACTMKAYADNMNSTDRGFDVCRRNLDHQLAQMALARELGVPVALGTDAGSPGVHHGMAVMAELGLLLESGYPVQEAVQCATLNGAALLGLKEIGWLKTGRSATFVAFRGEPGKLAQNLKNIERVCIGGAFIE